MTQPLMTIIRYGTVLAQGIFVAIDGDVATVRDGSRTYTGEPISSTPKQAPLHGDK